VAERTPPWQSALGPPMRGRELASQFSPPALMCLRPAAHLSRGSRYMDTPQTADHKLAAVALKVAMICISLAWAYAVGIVLAMLLADA
jgi:hypothetical protein